MSLDPRRRQLLAAAMASPWLAGRAWAQGFESPPSPGPELPPVLPPLAEARLANGLRLLVAERRGLPLLSLRLLVPALGSLGDPAGKAGLAQLHLSVMSRGALREGVPAGAGEIAFAAEGLGASLELASTARAGSLGLTLAASALEPALELLAELLLHPTLEAAEIERSREEMVDARAQRLADPAELAELLAGRLFWGESARGQQPTPAALARLQRRDLLELQRRIHPAQCTLVLAGDIDLAEAQALARQQFGAWRAPAGPLPELFAPLRPQPLAPRTVLVDQPGAAQAAIALAAPHAPAGEDEAAARLALALLGQGFSSRLNQALRIRRGLSYGAACEAESLPGAGMLLASTRTRPEHAAEAAALLGAELQGLAQEAPALPELQARRAALLGEQGRALETTAGLATLLAEAALDGRSLASLAQLPAQLAALQPGQLRDFAARHWAAEPQRRVVVADLAAAGADLRRLDPQALVIPQARLDLASPTLRSR